MAAYSTIPTITEIRKQKEMKPFSIFKKIFSEVQS